MTSLAREHPTIELIPRAPCIGADFGTGLILISPNEAPNPVLLRHLFFPLLVIMIILHTDSNATIYRIYI